MAKLKLAFRVVQDGDHWYAEATAEIDGKIHTSRSEPFATKHQADFAAHYARKKIIEDVRDMGLPVTDKFGGEPR